MVAIGDHEKVKHFGTGVVVLCLVGDLPLALLVLVPGTSMEHLRVEENCLPHSEVIGIGFEVP